MPSVPDSVSCPTPGKEPGLFDLVIINDNLDKAYATLKQALSEVGPSHPALSWGSPLHKPSCEFSKPCDAGAHTLGML